MQVIVASQNPTKLAGVTDAFTRVFGGGSSEAFAEISPNPSLPKEGNTGTSPFGKRACPALDAGGIEGDFELVVTGIKVDSGVGEQPMGDEQTMQGALNRAKAVRAAHPKADFWVGVEGGVVWYGDELECMAWVAVIGADGRIGKARSNGFLLPPALAALIASGVKQDLADDQVFGRANSGTTNGTVGYLSHNLITRTHYTADAVILALAPFVHPEHYPALSPPIDREALLHLRGVASATSEEIPSLQMSNTQ